MLQERCDADIAYAAAVSKCHRILEPSGVADDKKAAVAAGVPGLSGNLGASVDLASHSVITLHAQLTDKVLCAGNCIVCCLEVVIRVPVQLGKMADLMQQRVLGPLLEMTKRYKKACGALLEECETSRVSFQVDSSSVLFPPSC